MSLINSRQIKTELKKLGHRDRAVRRPVSLILGACLLFSACDFFGSNNPSDSGEKVAGGGTRTTNGEVAGRIKLADASPAEGVQIRLYQVFLTAKTGFLTSEWAGLSDSSGRFNFQNVPAGTFAMSVIDPAAGTKALMPRLTKNIEGYSIFDAVLAPSVTLRGRAFSAKGTNPESIKICIPGLSECTRPGADSTYSFPEAPQGEYDIVFMHNDTANYLPIQALRAKSDTLFIKDIQLDSPAVQNVDGFPFYNTDLKKSGYILPKLYPQTHIPTWYVGKSFDRIRYFVPITGNQFKLWDVEDYLDWKYRSAIPMPAYSPNDATKPTLFHFPLYLRLNRDQINFSQAAANGKDLRISRGDGTHLTYSIEKWDSTLGEAEIWVDIDWLGAANPAQRILIYWGNAEAQDRSEPAAALGPIAEARQLWPFDDNAASSLVKDKRGTHPGYLTRTSIGKDATANHTSLGVLGSSLKLDGNEDLITIDPHPVLDYAAMTILIWAKNSSATMNGRQYIVLKGDDHQRQWHIALDAGRRIHFGLGKPNGEWSGAWGSKNPVPDINTWHLYAVTFSKGIVHVYLDGVEMEAAAPAGIIPAQIPSHNSSIILGKSVLQSEKFWAGEVDNLVLENQVRSADWIKMIYETQKPVP